MTAEWVKYCERCGNWSKRGVLWKYKILAFY